MKYIATITRKDSTETKEIDFSEVQEIISSHGFLSITLDHSKEPETFQGYLVLYTDIKANNGKIFNRFCVSEEELAFYLKSDPDGDGRVKLFAIIDIDVKKGQGL